MRRTVVGLALVLLVASGLAQAAPGAIEVHVSASNPVVVSLMSGTQLTAVDVVPKGRRGCLLQNVAPGKYTLIASASAYASVTRAVAVRDGAETGVAITLLKLVGSDYKKLGRVVGFVKDADGKPVLNATLVLIKEKKAVGAARPGKAGVYELEWYAPGEYSVMVVAPGSISALYRGQTVRAGASARLDVVLRAG